MDDNKENKEIEEALKDALSKLIDENIDADIQEGEYLLEKCTKYDRNYKALPLCPLNNHQQEVLKYNDKINYKYKILINIFNFINNFGNLHLMAKIILYVVLIFQIMSLF